MSGNEARRSGNGVETPRTMTSTIRGAIARVDVTRDGRTVSRGTAFLVTPSAALTAFHVVADRAASTVELFGDIELEFPNARIKASLDPTLWDKEQDWALLRCERSPEASPLLVGALAMPGARWHSYGFPDARPDEGMVLTGTVEDHRARLGGAPALQLFSRQAAAGRGAPVRGLSGAPVLVGSQVVGHMRYALMRESETVAGTLFACPLTAVAERAPELLTEADFPRVAGYRLEQRLGEGGMGEVWLARQTDPRRQVALKIIKRGMDTKEVVARFEAERQALALMNHPNLAKVFEAGETSVGRPYFAMEHIKGEPITTYCDRNRLALSDRLELFIQVCEGVQHAHQKAVIHRDIKPSNILVSVEEDGDPRAKIIDFGVAKATSQELTQHTLFTALGQLVGTPEFMSPEQAEMTEAGIDTRTDVYSLGMVLYVLLTGMLPFDSRDLRADGLTEIRRKIREEEPPRPSSRVTALDDQAAQIAWSRSTDSAALVRLLRGDLDWITLRALHKDRARRYGSPAELAADLRRHLTNQPVLACPPARSYRMAKFLRRHRWGVSSAAAIVLALSVGVVGTSVGLIRARSEAARANHEANAARQVTDFLVDTFSVPAPRNSLGEPPSAREILDHGAQRLREELADQPDLRSRLLRTVGETYSELGFYEQAESLLREAMSLHELHGASDLERALVLRNVADVLGSKDQSLAEARRYAEEALQFHEKVEPALPLELAQSLHVLSAILVDLAEYEAAQAALERSLTIRTREVGDDHDLVASTLHDLGRLARLRGNHETALATLERAAEIWQALFGEKHPSLATAQSNISIVLFEQGRLEESIDVASRALRIFNEVYGQDHPETATQINVMGGLLHVSGRLQEAESSYRRALEIWQSRLGERSSRVAAVLNNLGELARDRGNFAAANDYFEQSMAMKELLLSPEDPRLGYTLGEWADSRSREGDMEAAESLYRRALEVYANGVGIDHPSALKISRRFVEFLESVGRGSEAQRVAAGAI